MIVDVSESYPGELNEEPDVLRAKLHKALHEALGQISLQKGGKARGGELRVLAELSDLTERLYAERTERLRADMASVAEGT